MQDKGKTVVSGKQAAHILTTVPSFVKGEYSAQATGQVLGLQTDSCKYMKTERLTCHDIPVL